MIIQGVNLDSLPDQFNDFKHGRILLYDGDGPCYRVACTVKRLDTAIRRLQQDILTQMFLTKAQHVRVHLTAHDSFKAGRFLVKATKPYQGNRTGKDKPALLEPLREAITHRENWLDEFSVLLHKELEADDGMIQEAYLHGENSLIMSDDKDLRMTPYPYWCSERGIVLASQPFGWLDAKYTPSGTMKCVGQGPLFFWAQMLMGDTADNVQGVKKLNGKLCGPKAALDHLKNCKDIHEAANKVIDAYRAINQNPVAEGQLLWLLRFAGDSVMQYFSEANLSQENKEFIHGFI